jgi:Na+/proline symporter
MSFWTQLALWLLLWLVLGMLWQHFATALMRQTQKLSAGLILWGAILLFLFILKPDLMEWLRSQM